MSERHRCSGCGHRWEGPHPGAELCGDCWRKGQAAILGRGRQRESMSVTVWRNGEKVVTIESNCLSGRDLLPGDEDVIYDAARNLLGFIGR